MPLRDIYKDGVIDRPGVLIDKRLDAGQPAAVIPAAGVWARTQDSDQKRSGDNDAESGRVKHQKSLVGLCSGKSFEIADNKPRIKRKVNNKD